MRQSAYGQRHASLIKPEAYDKTIAIVGCGAIGSHTAISLARMGYSFITLYDDDVVSEENMGSQGFYIGDIGKPKVDALASHIFSASGIKVYTQNKRVDAYDTLSDDIVIASVDSMNARREILQAYIREDGIFIDPRMGAEFARLFVLNMNNEKREAYKKVWYADSDAVQEACTAKATVYCANLLSGFVVKTVKDITNDEPYMRTLDFDIRKNSGEAWSSTGGKLF